MKKRIYPLSALLVVILMASILPLGFAQTEAKKDWPKTFVFVVMSAGAGAEALAPALTKEVQEKLGVSGQVTGGGGSTALVMAVARGEAHMTACGNHPVWEAWNGIGAFKKQGRQTTIRRLLYVYPGVLHWVARAATGIKTVKDWKGRRVMCDLPSNPIQGMVGDELLAANGMTRSDVVWLPQTSGQEANDSLQAGKADVIVRLGPPGKHPALKELATLVDLNCISLTDQEIKYVTDKLSFTYGPAMYPAGSYKGQGYDVRTVGYFFISSINASLPDSFVYELMKIVLDDVSKDTPGHFTQYHKDFNWTLNQQMQPALEVPWHNGAVKYFKDRGVWTEWMDKRQKELLAGIK